MFLGGNPLGKSNHFRQDLREFWERYKVVEPDLSFFGTVPECEWDTCIPLAIHGDEGRGKAKSPLMVVTTQVIMPLSEKKSNMQGNL